MNKVKLFFLGLCIFTSLVCLNASIPDIGLYDDGLPTLCNQFGTLAPTITMTGNTNSSNYAGTLENEVILIDGELTVSTSNFAIKNCTIKFTQGSKIIVTKDNKLTITDSDLFACTVMWKGIRVEEDGKLLMNYCNIEDAEKAIEAYAPRTLILYNNVFNRNHVGLYIKGISTKNIHCFLANIGNTFDCTSVLNQPIFGQNISWVGMWLEEIAGINVGWPSRLGNHFKNQMIGIYIKKSIVSIYDNTFAQMRDLGSFAGKSTGIGVYIEDNSFVCQRGLGMKATSPISFLDCENCAVNCLNSILCSYSNHIVNCGASGIVVLINDNHYVEIRNNRIVGGNISNYHAISIRRGAFNNDVIQNNHIVRDLYTYLGQIHFYDLNQSSGNAYIISNILTLNNAVTAMDIHPNNGDNVHVEDNVINSSTGGLIGIDFSSSLGENYTISNNSIDIYSNSVYSIGLRMADSNNSMVCDNTFSNMGNAIQVEKNCMGSKLIENTFNNHIIGLHLTKTTTNIEPILEFQVHNGNRWEGAYTDVAARYNGASVPTEQFKVNDNTATGGDPTFYPNSNGLPSVFPMNNWFVKQDKPSHTCDVILPYAGGGETELTELEKRIADGTFADMMNHEMTTYLSERYLFRKISRHPELISENNGTSDFFSQKEIAPMGLFSEVEARLKEAIVSNSAFVGALKSLQSKIRTDLDSLQALDTLMDIETDNPSEAQFLLIKSLASNAALSSQLIEDYSPVRAQILQDAASINESISTDKEYELFEKTVNNILINYLLHPLDTLPQNEINELIYIASLCPERGGLAIYKAKSLLLTQNIYSPRQNDCNNLERAAKISSFSTENKKFVVNPKPAKDLVNISIKEYIENHNYAISIHNLNDIKLQDLRHLQSNNVKINISDFAPGIYFVRLYDQGRLVQVEKIIKL